MIDLVPRQNCMVFAQVVATLIQQFLDLNACLLLTAIGNTVMFMLCVCKSAWGSLQSFLGWCKGENLWCGGWSTGRLHSYGKSWIGVAQEVGFSMIVCKSFTLFPKIPLVNSIWSHFMFIWEMSSFGDWPGVFLIVFPMHIQFEMLYLDLNLDLLLKSIHKCAGQC